MTQYVTVANVGDVPDGKGKHVMCQGQSIALFFVDGQYYALDDYCPHMGESLWCGEVCEGEVICDRHRWAFNLQSGVCVDAPTLKAGTFPVRVQGKEIQVGLPAEE